MNHAFAFPAVAVKFVDQLVRAHGPLWQRDFGIPSAGKIHRKFSVVLLHFSISGVFMRHHYSAPGLSLFHRAHFSVACGLQFTIILIVLIYKKYLSNSQHRTSHLYS